MREIYILFFLINIRLSNCQIAKYATDLLKQIHIANKNKSSRERDAHRGVFGVTGLKCYLLQPYQGLIEAKTFKKREKMN